MPYIKESDRYELDMDPHSTTNSGELNYVFTTMANSYWQRNGQNYQAFNDIIGALENCKLELYRRMIAPYEDQKIKDNGDVYGGEGNKQSS